MRGEEMARWAAQQVMVARPWVGRLADAPPGGKDREEPHGDEGADPLRCVAPCRRGQSTEASDSPVPCFTAALLGWGSPCSVRAATAAAPDASNWLLGSVGTGIPRPSPVDGAAAESQWAREEGLEAWAALEAYKICLGCFPGCLGSNVWPTF